MALHTNTGEFSLFAVTTLLRCCYFIIMPKVFFNSNRQIKRIVLFLKKQSNEFKKNERVLYSCVDDERRIM